MNTPLILAKSSLLSFCIFWGIIFIVDFEPGMFGFIVLSIIPISIVCSTFILFTIFPFFWRKSNKVSKANIFRTYFPFYAIIVFGFSLFGTIIAKFYIFPISFFASAFFTTMQAWVWFSRDYKNKTPQ